MDEASYADGLPVAAIATPLAESALAILRVTGKGSLSLLARVFSRPEALDASENARAVHGWILSPMSGERVDEVVALVWRTPGGYTGEDAADLICHGSPAAASAILDALLASGFRRALPGEFTLRAFRNGKTDLTRAEAAAEMSAARTERARRSAARRLSGALEARVRAIRETLLGSLAAAEMALDYAEGEDDPDAAVNSGSAWGSLPNALADLETLRASYSSGRLAREGASVAIMGRTNAGKSALFNLFLKEDRAIVSDIHGTTRDWLEAWIELGGLPIRIYDTAGLRDSGDTIEREGMERGLRVAESADLILLLEDAARADGAGAVPGAGTALDAEDVFDRPDVAARTIKVWSRADIGKGEAPAGMLRLSSLTGEGFKDLESAILARLAGGAGHEGSVEIASARQKRLLDAASASLRRFMEGAEAGEPLDALAPELGEAVGALGELLGEEARADILEEIFSRFCVGK
jgi:tRNA modification GTPase